MKEPIKIRKIINTNRGLTLVESLVAITILVIGVMGPLSVSTRGITDGLYAQNQLMATYLAQEGLELLSAQVDENISPSENYTPEPGNETTGLESCGTVCALQFGAACGGAGAGFNEFCFKPCVEAADCQIMFSEANNFYENADCGTSCNLTGPAFTRELSVEVDEKDIFLLSVVEWRNRPTDPTPKQVTFYRYVYNSL